MKPKSLGNIHCQRFLFVVPSWAKQQEGTLNYFEFVSELIGRQQHDAGAPLELQSRLKGDDIWRRKGMNLGILLCYGNRQWGIFKTLRFVTTQRVFSVLIFITAIARPSGRSSKFHSKQPFLSSQAARSWRTVDIENAMVPVQGPSEDSTNFF